MRKSIQSICCIFFILVNIVSADQLLMIQQIFRHGARYPLFSQKVDHSDFALNQNSAGQLTPQGKNMQYILGKILYRKYWKLLFQNTPYQNSYNQSQIYVKSTDVNRTIQSAQSQLFGLLEALPKLTLNPQNYQYSLPAWKGEQFPEQQQYENSTWNVFKTGPVFHPVPIHVEKIQANPYDQGDFLIKFDIPLCPNQFYWIKQNLNTQQLQTVKNDQRCIEAIKALSSVVKKTVSFQHVYKWRDSYSCMKYLGYDYLTIFQDPKHAQILDFIQVYTMYLKRFSQKEQIRAIGTNILKQTLQNLQSKVNETYSPRITLYSAHDSTICMMLSVLNMTNLNCIIDHYLKKVNNDETCIWSYPQFASNIIFQLWKNQSGNHYIKILYEGVPRKIPICGGKIQCPLEDFKVWASQFMVDDVNKACGIKLVEKTLYYTAIVFILVVAVIILTFCNCYIRHKRKIEISKMYKQYNQHIDEKNELQLPDSK